MNSFHFTSVVHKNEIVLKGLPFSEGDSVEVVVFKLSSDTKSDKGSLPLHGTLIEYQRPSDPVAMSDWEVLNDNP